MAKSPERLHPPELIHEYVRFNLLGFQEPRMSIASIGISGHTYLVAINDRKGEMLSPLKIDHNEIEQWKKDRYKDKDYQAALKEQQQRRSKEKLDAALKARAKQKEKGRDRSRAR